MRPTSVLIVDSHRAAGAALAAALRTEPDRSAVEVVGSVDAAEAAPAAHDVDLPLLDPQPSRGDGLEFIGSPGTVRGVAHRCCDRHPGPGLCTRVGPPSVGEAIANLSARERQILLYMIDGLDRQTIANMLFASTHTARTQIQSLLGKLSVHSGGVRSGLANPDTHPTGGRG